MNWFICKISHEEMSEKGVQRKVTKLCLIDALSYTEAEARIIQEMKPYITGEFTVADIRRYRLAELFNNVNGDRWYIGKVAFITIDEKSGKEKRTKVNMLAEASDIMEAESVIKEGMKGSMADYVIEEIKETKITDVFPYTNKENV